MGLSSNNKLFEMITPFNSTDDYISGIDYVIKEIPKEGRIPAIYGINGQRTTLTKQGVYIIVDTKGNRKKVIISQQHN